MARTLNNLARMYRAQGMYSEAEKLHMRVLKICEEAFGMYHLDVAESYYCLAKLYFVNWGIYSDGNTCSGLSTRVRLLIE